MTEKEFTTVMSALGYKYGYLAPKRGKGCAYCPKGANPSWDGGTLNVKCAACGTYLVFHPVPYKRSQASA
jgi:hypothetical protein